MERQSAASWPKPWLGLTLAAITGVFVYALSDEAVLAAAMFLLWASSLWLSASRAPEVSRLSSSDKSHANRLEAIIEHSSNPILLAQNSRIILANKAARDKIGAHIVGQSTQIVFRHPGAIALLAKGENGQARIHGLVQRKDVWLLSIHVIQKDEMLIELVNHSAEADVARTHTDFVANASHELRTPLASIIGYAETLLDDTGEAPKPVRTKFLTTIHSEAKRLQNIVMDLITLSYIEAEKHDQPQDVFALAPLVSRSAKDAAGLERAERLNFSVSTEANIKGDSRQIEQLVRNLVDNALKYGASGESVDVSLQSDGDGYVRLLVADKGEGIAPDHLPFLTRRFYRTDEGRSRATGGTGLGLAIAKHIVERHGGRLMINSQLGEGTQVSVLLPIASSDEEAV